MDDTIRLFSGSSNPQLAERIATELGIPLDEARIAQLSNNDLYISLGASLRRRRIFIVQSFSQPSDRYLMELLMMLDIARRAAAAEVVAIIPYFSFGRSDTRIAPRSSVTARLVADLLKTAGATHVMSMTLHSPQVPEFFDIPIDALSPRSLFRNYLFDLDLTDSILVTPDVGQAKAGARLARILELPFVTGIKDRITETEVTIHGITGNQIRGKKRAIIYDDEIASGNTVLELSRVLVSEGVEDIRVFCTHGAFQSDGFRRLVDVAAITEIIITDTVYIPSEIRHPKLKILSVAPVFADAIGQYLQQESSTKDLFVFGDSLSGDSTTDAPPPPKKKEDK